MDFRKLTIILSLVTLIVALFPYPSEFSLFPYPTYFSAFLYLTLYLGIIPILNTFCSIFIAYFRKETTKDLKIYYILTIILNVLIILAFIYLVVSGSLGVLRLH